MTSCPASTWLSLLDGSELPQGQWAQALEPQEHPQPQLAKLGPELAKLGPKLGTSLSWAPFTPPEQIRHVWDTDRAHVHQQRTSSPDFKWDLSLPCAGAAAEPNALREPFQALSSCKDKMQPWLGGVSQ